MKAKLIFVLTALALLVPIAGQAQSKNGIQIVLAGDANLHRRLSVYDDPAYLDLFKRLRQSDVRFVNFESLIHNYEFAGSPFAGGINSYSPGWITDELKWAGFNLLSVANNHAFDWGADGLRSSLHALDEAGLVYAGAGENLAFARAPSYLDTKNGRVALIGISATLNPESPASEQRPDLRGRFGVDPLRYTTTYVVDQSTIDGLRKLVPHQQPYGGTDNGKDPIVKIGQLRFKQGSSFGAETEADPADVAGLIASIRNARREADWVIVSIHAHESKGPEQPADFVRKFAHDAIDAGADVFAIHGPHDAFRGIEIYKGKPIFYSLGNFAFDGDTQPFLPSEKYEQYHLPQETSNIADIFDVVTEKETGGLLNDKLNWESAIAEVTFGGDGKVKKIVLDPISLGLGDSRSQRGRPRPASPEIAQDVIDRVTKLSAPLGTKVEFVDGKGVIDLEK
jgi:poly-gamma-glutamate capsule biosynthesis protein CapA/YwtB (metallophosphatase superfamily)